MKDKAKAPEGRLQLFNGDYYYSPNSKRTLSLAPPSTQGGNPFDPKASNSPKILAQDLLHVWEWSAAFGWLAFLPFDPPEYRRHPLRQLAYAPHITEKGDSSFGLQTSTKDSWRCMERAVYHAVTTLKNRYHLPLILPHLPWAYGYLKAWTDPNFVADVAQWSQDWFMVWLAALSFCIVIGETPRLGDPPSKDKRHPDWYNAIMEDDGLARPSGRDRPSTLVSGSTSYDRRLDFGHITSWLDGIRSSFICDFKHVHRVGCILNITRPAPGQPEIAWFKSHNIPIWYKWNPEEHHAALQSPRLASLACRG
jgi:hypothetical protein